MNYLNTLMAGILIANVITSASSIFIVICVIFVCVSIQTNKRRNGRHDMNKGGTSGGLVITDYQQREGIDQRKDYINNIETIIELDPTNLYKLRRDIENFLEICCGTYIPEVLICYFTSFQGPKILKPLYKNFIMEGQNGENVIEIIKKFFIGLTDQFVKGIGYLIEISSNGERPFLDKYERYFGDIKPHVISSDDEMVEAFWMLLFISEYKVEAIFIAIFTLKDEMEQRKNILILIPVLLHIRLKSKILKLNGDINTVVDDIMLKRKDFRIEFAKILNDTLFAHSND